MQYCGEVILAGRRVLVLDVPSAVVDVCSRSSPPGLNNSQDPLRPPTVHHPFEKMLFIQAMGKVETISI